jgi:TPR repeat protein
MGAFHQQRNLIAVFISAILSMMGCTEKEATQQTESNTSSETEDKIARLQREAQQGSPDAQYELAYLYENGIGVAKDEAKALELYQQAADQGHPAAKTNLDDLKNEKQEL